MKEFWNERYALTEYVYGTEPNDFYKQTIRSLTPGKALLPAEGEGRNAVFAAQLGWEVTAFDQSNSAKKKAMQLAHQKKVVIHYDVHDVADLHLYPESYFDLIVLIFVHLPELVRKEFHQGLIKLLKPGGKLILEAFNPDQLGKKSGGPQRASLLYSENMLKQDFSAMTITTLNSMEVELNEGEYHKGLASVVRMIAYKN